MSSPRVVTIAGLDPSGGAGLTSDLAVFAAFGCRGAAVATALTAQDAGGVRDLLAVDAEFVGRQIRSVLADGVPDAAKTGMLLTRATVLVVASFVEREPRLPVVVDPVLSSSDGVALLEEDAIAALLERLVPLATLVTPNAPEAARLTGVEVDGPEGAQSAAETLLERGAGAVLVKGGHLPGDEVVDTLFVRGSAPRTFSRRRVTGARRRGTGCALSAAVAAGLARGLPLAEAVELACRYVHEAILRADGDGGALTLRRSVRVEGMA